MLVIFAFHFTRVGFCLNFHLFSLFSSYPLISVIFTNALLETEEERIQGHHNRRCRSYTVKGLYSDSSLLHFTDSICSYCLRSENFWFTLLLLLQVRAPLLLRSDLYMCIYIFFSILATFFKLTIYRTHYLW